MSRSIYCYFHKHWYVGRKTKGPRRNFALELPVLEDAASIQTAVMQVLRLMLNNQIDDKKAALLLYGLQTAAATTRSAEFEPEPTKVVLGLGRIAATALGDAAWYKEEFIDEDESDEEDAEEAVVEMAAEAADEAEPKASSAADDKSLIDPRKPKPPARAASRRRSKLPPRIEDWATDQAMEGLQTALTIMDEEESRVELRPQ